KVDDFSIPLNFLEENHNNIDILFLLHYQGLVNSEYDEIISFCKENKIIVIEDLAHVLESSYDLKGDFGIYSYAFDKPLTSFSGGKVELNYNNSDFYDCFVEEYGKLPFESEKNVENDIKLLKYFMHASRENVFKPNLDNRDFVNALVNTFSENNIVTLLGNNLSYFVFRLIFKIKNKFLNAGLDSPYEVLRLNYKKIALINIQYERSMQKREDLLILQKNIIERLVGNDVVAEIKTDFLWNRISFIPKDVERLPNEVQYGNFNWPTPLHIMYSDLPNVSLSGDYPNTSFVSKSVVNFPCWSEKILHYLA
ncbi:DegT/DnrJ/EryC1/StrS aminotransferase family protein, partial [Vibrio anguillarum]